MRNRVITLFIISLVIFEFLLSTKLLLGVKPQLALIGLAVLSTKLRVFETIMLSMVVGYLSDILMSPDRLSHFLGYLIAIMLMLILRKSLPLRRNSALSSSLYAAVAVVTFEVVLVVLSNFQVFLSSWLTYIAAQGLVSSALAYIWVRGATLFERRV